MLLASGPSLLRKTTHFIPKRIPEIRCLTPSKIANNGTKQESRDLNCLILFTFCYHSHRLRYLLFCVVRWARGVILWNSSLSEGEESIRRECANAVRMCDVFMVVPLPPGHTCRTPAKPQNHLFFSWKVKAGFIHSLEDKEFAILISEVSIASASLLPER